MNSYCPYGCGGRGWILDEVNDEAIRCPEHKPYRMRGPDEQRALPYRVYLRSPEWAKKRQHFLERADNRCEVCSTPRKLQVHHLTYENVGAERSEDVAVLCARCHAKAHGIAVEQAEKEQVRA